MHMTHQQHRQPTAHIFGGCWNRKGCHASPCMVTPGCYVVYGERTVMSAFNKLLELRAGNGHREFVKVCALRCARPLA
jgi:hypothetical protein